MTAPLATPAEPVATMGKHSKSFAQRYLRRFFLGARFQTTTTPADVTEGKERWALWCVGSAARQIPVIEVAGPPSHLPDAMIVAGLRRLGLEATLSDKGISIKPLIPNEAEKHG